MHAAHGGRTTWMGCRWALAARLVIGVVAAVFAGGLTGRAAEPPSQAGGIRLATFDVDATPPLGAALAYGPVIKEGPLALRCRGTVLLVSGEPIVLAAIDWIGIGNEAHDSFREAIADAAGTSADRVAVHALHQHDAPQADFTAEKLLGSLGVQGHDRFRGDFAREVFARTARAVREALPRARRVTHAGFGRAQVQEVASNRRIIGPDGKLVVWRASATRDAAARDLPEGLVDPDLATLVLFDDEIPVAALTSYATHPMSYYRTGVPGPDFPGIARLIRSEEVPAALHVHFTGAAGNIAAGKYNDGSPANRVTLALRMAAAMRQSYERAIAARTPVSAADVGWGIVPVVLEARADLDCRVLEEQVRTKPDRGTFSALDALAFAARAERRHAIPVTCLRVGSSRMLHLPGELFVEFQLAARAMRPDLGVFMAAYGDYGPGYIGTAASYAEGGYEVQPSSSFVGPEAEERLLAAIRTLLMP